MLQLHEGGQKRNAARDWRVKLPRMESDIAEEADPECWAAAIASYKLVVREA
jgi:hypothetical protein